MYLDIFGVCKWLCMSGLVIKLCIVATSYCIITYAMSVHASCSNIMPEQKVLNTMIAKQTD